MHPGEVGAAFQRRYRNQLKGVVEMVLDRSLGSPGLALSMSRLLDHEEELYKRETEIALLESQVKEVDEAARKRVNQLRRAVIDLSQERERLVRELGLDGGHSSSANLRGRLPTFDEGGLEGGQQSVDMGSPQGRQDMYNDITYQIRILESRLMEVTKDREKHIKEIEKKLAKKCQENYEWESRLSKLEGDLTRQLHLVRERCTGHPHVRQQIQVLDGFYSEMLKHSQQKRR